MEKEKLKQLMELSKAEQVAQKTLDDASDIFEFINSKMEAAKSRGDLTIIMATIEILNEQLNNLKRENNIPQELVDVGIQIIQSHMRIDTKRRVATGSFEHDKS